MEIINNIENNNICNNTINANSMGNIDSSSKHIKINDIKKSDIQISNMSISDLDSIKYILETDFDDFWNYNIFKSELENIYSKYIVAKLEDEIIGFAGVWFVIDEAHITNIVTKKAYRGKGIGNILLENLIDLCKSINENITKNNNTVNACINAINSKSTINTTKISFLTLEVSEDNLTAQNLYKKFNFKVLGKRKNYYRNKSAIIMTLYF